MFHHFAWEHDCRKPCWASSAFGENIITVRWAPMCGTANWYNNQSQGQNIPKLRLLCRREFFCIYSSYPASTLIQHNMILYYFSNAIQYTPISQNIKTTSLQCSVLAEHLRDDLWTLFHTNKPLITELCLDGSTGQANPTTGFGSGEFQDQVKTKSSMSCAPGSS